MKRTVQEEWWKHVCAYASQGAGRLLIMWPDSQTLKGLISMIRQCTVTQYGETIAPENQSHWLWHVPYCDKICAVTHCVLWQVVCKGKIWNADSYLWSEHLGTSTNTPCNNWFVYCPIFHGFHKLVFFYTTNLNKNSDFIKWNQVLKKP